jgi:D-glycerate 3-kinase
MLNFFKKIKVKNFKILKLPKFNKGVDDRCKQSLWYKIQSKPDVVILEGWCVGARSQNSKELKKPVNSLEKIHDQNFKWRQYVNYQLKTKYKKLFNQLDYILFLKAKNFSLLRRWRLKQEKKLWLKSKNKKNLKIMNKSKVKNFMDTYQRVTQQMFKDMPKYSSIVMNLNNSHQIKNIKYR